MDIERTCARRNEPVHTALGLLLFLVASCSSDGSGSPGGPSATSGLGGIPSDVPGAAGGTGGGGAGSPSGVGGSAVPATGPGGAVSGNSGGQFSGRPTGGAGGVAGASSSGGTPGAGGAPPGASGNGAGGTGGAAGTSGGAGAGGVGGTGGNAPYSPCPTDSKPCKILPLGDSITYGLGTSDQSAYRVELFRRAVAAGQHITYLGSLMAGPSMVDGMPFPRNNEGHSGWTIDQVAGLVPSPALKDNPDIILLLIGTNDMYMGSPGTAPQRLASLLDKILAVSDHPLLVVAQITPLASGNSAVMTYNAAIPALVQTRAMAGKHIALVDMYTGFSTTMLADGVHPNAQGNALMANVWYAAIKDVLH